VVVGDTLNHFGRKAEWFMLQPSKGPLKLIEGIPISAIAALPRILVEDVNQQ